MPGRTSSRRNPGARGRAPRHRRTSPRRAVRTNERSTAETISAFEKRPPDRRRVPVAPRAPPRLETTLQKRRCGRSSCSSSASPPPPARSAPRARTPARCGWLVPVSSPRGSVGCSPRGSPPSPSGGGGHEPSGPGRGAASSSCRWSSRAPMQLSRARLREGVGRSMSAKNAVENGPPAATTRRRLRATRVDGNALHPRWPTGGRPPRARGRHRVLFRPRLRHFVAPPDAPLPLPRGGMPRRSAPPMAGGTGSLSPSRRFSHAPFSPLRASPLRAAEARRCRLPVLALCTAGRASSSPSA
jgi:hypothetical protein